MNGSLHPHLKYVDIKLKRGPAGLGFNILGGVDQPCRMNDNGIYVSKIKEDGAAALDGRLKEEDKIIAINGVSLENRTHTEVVDLFRTAGENVELRVLKKSPFLTNGPADCPPEGQSSSMSSLGMLALFAGAVTIFVIAALYKRRK
ncbi:synaptojanin-2-binding protein [Fundulus diaphanus]